MSIDYGDKRVGIALSDPMHTISYPLGVINRIDDKDLINQIFKIITEKKIEKIIIGLPISMSGSHSFQTKKVISFKDVLIEELLGQQLNIEVDTIDERLSSVSAKRIMIQQGIKTGHNKGKIDELKSYFLQGGTKSIGSESSEDAEVFETMLSEITQDAEISLRSRRMRQERHPTSERDSYTFPKGIPTP